VTGIDTFISAWPQSFLNFPGEDDAPAAPTPGLRVVPGRGPAPSWFLEAGDEFHKLMRLAHRSWALIRDGGVDQVIDHVMMDNEIRRDALEVLTGAYWVGVYCNIEEMVRRESARGDRPTGFASGSSAVAHDEMTYDLTVDTTTTSSEENASLLYRTFHMI
jgi:chloramphenicol 3-O phosphotransferase